jgi:hypothetical protein
MRQCIILMVIFIVGLVAFSSIQAQDIVGRWKTIDDETGKAKSIVNIYIEDGKYFGKIDTLFREEGEDPDPVR